MVVLHLQVCCSLILFFRVQLSFILVRLLIQLQFLNSFHLFLILIIPLTIIISLSTSLFLVLLIFSNSIPIPLFTLFTFLLLYYYFPLLLIQFLYINNLIHLLLLLLLFSHVNCWCNFRLLIVYWNSPLLYTKRGWNFKVLLLLLLIRKFKRRVR